MKYLVLEIQKASDGQVATLINSYDSLEIAEQAYFTTLASACASSVFVHTVMLISDEGFCVEQRSFRH